MVGLCDVLNVIIQYVSVMALLEIDKFTFLSLSNTMPFKSIVMSGESKPRAFIIDHTTSLKNNWANKVYLVYETKKETVERK